MLEEIKILLGIKDDESDDLLYLYIKRATYTIRVYLNTDKYTDEELLNLYGEAIKSLVIDARRIETSKSKGIKSIAQGARSITYADDKSFTISDEVRAILPVPYLKMGG